MSKSFPRKDFFHHYLLRLELLITSTGGKVLKSDNFYQNIQLSSNELIKQNIYKRRVICWQWRENNEWLKMTIWYSQKKTCPYMDDELKISIIISLFLAMNKEFNNYKIMKFKTVIFVSSFHCTPTDGILGTVDSY